jgi:hypothetical protein
MDFRTIVPGARVKYRTAQGYERTAKACRYLIFASHVVCDAGRGVPVVVDSLNYISHKEPRHA